MNTIAFNEILLKTAFCCMAADGQIDEREVSQIKNMCEKSPLFNKISIQDEINQYVAEINSKGKEFIKEYFSILNESEFSNQEELTLIGFAIQTINADDEIEYSEIKFFKNIRHRLKLSDECILAVFPDIEQYLEEDIITESFLDKITKQYFDLAKLPVFELINIDSKSQTN